MLEDPRSIGFGRAPALVRQEARAASAHATNIAETMRYLLTGDMLWADRPKADGSGGVDPNWGHTKI